MIPSAQNLLPTWVEIEKYLSWGISILPVRDKDDEYGVAKSPFGASWKAYQSSIIDKETLFDLMQKHNTTAIGGIGGVVSGNLEIIDIDVKYKAGIDAVIFKDLQFLYLDTFSKLRIHRSASGGFHIIYRCESPVSGSKKLASRPATEAEAAKSKQKTYTFIETRGEGGYVLLPPSMGYSVVQDNPIPVLTLAERDSMLGLMRSYDEIVKVENSAPKPAPKSSKEYYSTNPFEDYNNRCDPSNLMVDMGWTVYKENSRFIWYTRPGKNKGVSMSWNHEKRFFFCFTASTELEENKGYTPTSILTLLKHSGDKKAVYNDIVSQGYGVINAKTEAKIARIAAVNPSAVLPANISAAAVSAHAEIVAQIKETYPHGTFWIESPTDGVMIDRELLYAVSHGLGFRLYNSFELVRIDETYIYKTTDREYFDHLKFYISEPDEALQKDVCNAWEVFIERHGAFTISRLQIMPRSAVLEDTTTDSYKFYSNGVLHITENGYQITPYHQYKKLIWHSQIQSRPFTAFNGGRYVEFLSLSTDFNNHVRACIGFLAHQYKDETTGYIVTCTEKCENPKNGGGSGKNIFCKTLAYTTTYNSKPGSQVKYDEKFLNSWNGERIFCLSDVPKHFDYSFLKELSTGSGLMKKLFKNEYAIDVQDMPKFIIQTNYGIDIKDGGVKRRVMIVEFTDFFTKCGGVDVYFGCHFPNGWDSNDWAGYDTCIAECIQLWLKAKMKIQPAPISIGMWHKQWAQEYGQVATEFVRNHIEDWCAEGWVSNIDFRATLEAHYTENNTPKNMQPSSVKIYECLKSYCSYHDIDFLNNIPKREGYSVIKKKWFGKSGSTPF